MTNKESQAVEYKQNWRNDCLKAVSAFANSDGGKLIIEIYGTILYPPVKRKIKRI